VEVIVDIGLAALDRSLEDTLPYVFALLGLGEAKTIRCHG